jgi:hypothetical protein
MSGAAASGAGSVVGKGAIKAKSGGTTIITEEKGFEPEAHFYPRQVFTGVFVCNIPAFVPDEYD